VRRIANHRVELLLEHAVNSVVKKGVILGHALGHP